MKYIPRARHNHSMHGSVPPSFWFHYALFNPAILSCIYCYTSSNINMDSSQFFLLTHLSLFTVNLARLFSSSLAVE